jgi:hypothetical protein
MHMQGILLVLIGVLGDLAWRKFLDDARKLEGENESLAVLYVDVPWPNSDEVALSDELRWRIGRRRIELRAEEISGGNVKGLRLKSSISDTRLPWEVDAFVKEHLEGTDEDLEKERQMLQRFIDDWLGYLTEPSPLTGMVRYAPDPEALRGDIEKLREDGWKVTVFVATPPQAYPAIIDQWRGLADRIVLEKPAGCLDPGKLTYAGTEKVREAAGRLIAPAQIATNDHYNAKLVTRVLDRVSDLGIFDSLLDPDRIQRIVVQLVEPAPLPLGRNGFYNGAGGACGDMASHLLQMVRALLGLPQGELKVRFDEFHWARCESISQTCEHCPTERPYVYEPHYYQPLHVETETFVAFKGTVEVRGRSIPLYCRTGKGLRPGRKTLRVDTLSRSGDSVISLIFDLGEGTLKVKNGYDFILKTGKLSLTDPFQSGVPSVDTDSEIAEYKGIFQALVQSEWTNRSLDDRYFPSVSQAADMSDIIFERLVEERAKRGAGAVLSYATDKPETYFPVLALLDEEADWDYAQPWTGE